MRIIWQGFTDPSVHRPYTDRLQAYLTEVADPGTEFVFMGVSPPDRYVNRLTELRCAVQALGNMLAREDEFDGMILGHFQDAGLWEARAALDIPVVGLGETSMLHACTLGYRVGLITIHPTFIGWHEEQVRRYGLWERVVAVRAMETTPEVFMRAFEEADAAADVRAQFEQQARPLVEAGVEVLIPAGGLPALLFARDGLDEVDGAVILNPTLVVAKQAELAVRLRRANGTRPSRSGVFMRAPDEARREFLEQIAPTGG
jgi:allantoin racemase